MPKRETTTQDETNTTSAIAPAEGASDAPTTAEDSPSGDNQAGHDVAEAGQADATDGTATESGTATSNDEPKPGEGANLFRIRRVETRPVQTAVTVPTSPRTTVVRFDEGESVFDVDQLTARAAVDTHNFEIAPDSRMRLKE